jgi:hypothetical protein
MAAWDERKSLYIMLIQMAVLDRSARGCTREVPAPKDGRFPIMGLLQVNQALTPNYYGAVRPGLRLAIYFLPASMRTHRTIAYYDFL